MPGTFQSLNGFIVMALIIPVSTGCGQGERIIPGEPGQLSDEQIKENSKKPSAEMLTDQGDALTRKSKWDEAIKMYDEAIRVNPNHADAFSGRAIARLNVGQVDEALKDADEAIRINPKFSEAFANRANIWYSKKEYEKSIKDYDESIRLDPDFAVVFSNPGFVHAAKGQWDQAIRDYDEAIRLDPGYSAAFENRGRAWQDKGTFPKALRDFDEAIRLDPQNAPAWRNRAWLKATCPDSKYRDGKSAVEDAKRGGELNGWTDPYYFSTLAAAFAECGDFEDAVKWQEKALADAKYRRNVGLGGTDKLNLYRARKPYHKH